MYTKHFLMKLTLDLHLYYWNLYIFTRPLISVETLQLFCVLLVVDVFAP